MCSIARGPRHARGSLRRKTIVNSTGTAKRRLVTSHKGATSTRKLRHPDDCGCREETEKRRVRLVVSLSSAESFRIITFRGDLCIEKCGPQAHRDNRVDSSSTRCFNGKGSEVFLRGVLKVHL
jgi:hypothetical protein